MIWAVRPLAVIFIFDRFILCLNTVGLANLQISFPKTFNSLFKAYQFPLPVDHK